jgi:dTDP-glucose pyrophosphorylase
MERRTRELTTAVVLAAGRGTRMRAPTCGEQLDPVQRQAADRGLKGLIPFHGHAFLSYVLTSLADAGYVDVCLVVGPGVDPIRAHYEAVSVKRLALRFAVQDEPLGSAHALLAAEQLVQDQDFALINSDNLYPVEALDALRALDGPGLIGFRRAGLLNGNITPDRLLAYALITATADGELEQIIEKPSPTQLARATGDGLFSMTCWRFGRSIFAACRAIPRSTRGEYELPDAVRHAIHTEHERFRVIPLDDAVLDLSRREDILTVQRLLSERRVEL